jgi:guanylate kinase
VTARVVVLSAPSGGGKTTIARAVRDRYPDRFGFSVSATTRKKRVGEQDSVDYHFWTKERFRNEVQKGAFLEHAEYAGELYGTLKNEVDRVLRSGQHVLLDIDVQGAAQVRKQYPDERAVLIFILPSDPQVLLERLVKRKSESHAELKLRIDRAKYELGQARTFDRWVRNDDLDEAVQDVREAVEQGGSPRTLPQDLNWLNKYGSELQKKAQQVFDELHQQKG